MFNGCDIWASVNYLKKIHLVVHFSIYVILYEAPIMWQRLFQLLYYSMYVLHY